MGKSCTAWRASSFADFAGQKALEFHSLKLYCAFDTSPRDISAEIDPSADQENQDACERDLCRRAVR